MATSESLTGEKATKPEVGCLNVLEPELLECSGAHVFLASPHRSLPPAITGAYSAQLVCHQAPGTNIACSLF